MSKEPAAISQDQEWNHLSFRLSDDFIKSYEDRKPPFGFDIGGGNTLGELTWLTKYSRTKDDGTKERWYEGCRRVVEGVYSILKDHCTANRTPWNAQKSQRAAEDMYDRLWSMKWTPPGRGLWMMGTKFVMDEGSAALQNCSFISTENLGPRNATLPFVRLMEMSMLGIGVGFDTRGADKLTVHRPSDEDVTTYVVPDSREGWCESLNLVLRSYLLPNQSKVQFDYSQIRPAGEPIKRFGGVAAGPAPLERLHREIRRIFDRAIGEPFSSTLIVDVGNMVGKCVVAGNVRRSAEIALGFANDQDFLELKDWNVNPERMGGDGWGHLSNNSIMVSTGDNLDPLVDKIAINGEPGILYMDLMRSHGRLIDPPNHKDSRAKGCNPCVTGDTWVQTVNGPRQVDDLIDVSVPLLVNGLPYEMESNGFFSTGKRPVLAITTTDGREVKVTAEHPMMTPDGWVEAGDLTIGDILVLHDHGTTRWDGPGSDAEGYLLGLLIGDGTFMGNRNRATLCSWGEGSGPAASRDEAERAFNSLNLSTRSDFKGWGGPHGNGWMRFAPKALTTLAAQYGVTADSKTITKAIEQGGSSLAIGVLRGLFDADGHVEGKTKDKGCSIRLSNTDRNLLTAVQRMLGRLGINSRVYGMREAGQRSLPGGEYECKKSWRLVIGGNHCARFMDAVGFSDIEKATKYHETMIGARHYEKSFTSEIASIDSLGTQPTWDVTVESVHAFDANGFYVSNCAEQTLENMECCTLVETYPTNCEDFEDFRRTLKAAYMYGKAVTLLPTHWPESNEVMKRNHRIGTSVTGLTMFAEEHGWTTLRQWLDDGYAEIQRRDRQYSEWLGVRESVKTTSVKPSGTVSLLAGVTPGVHWPVAGEQYFRRVRYSKIDPIIPVLEAAGYHVEASVADPDADVVVTFPTTGPKVRSEREVSVWEKVNLAGLLQKYWADNMVSATFTFAPHEEREVGSILRAMDGQLKSMSFLPMGEELSAGAYPQMPYEKVSDEEFLSLQGGVTTMDMEALYASGREADGERYCSNDTCEVKF